MTFGSSKNRVFKTVLALLAVFVLLAIVLLYFRIFGPGSEIYQKSIYAEIQGVELQYRNRELSTPVVLDSVGTQKLRVAGFKTDDKNFPYAWLALTLENPDRGIYMVPGDAKLEVSCASINGLLEKEKSTAAAVSFLKNQCKRE